jgi:leucyl aminopeptidase
MNVTMREAELQSVEADAIVVNLFQGVQRPAGATGAIDAALGGAITELIASGDLTGKLGRTATLYSRGAIPAARVVVVGLGPSAEFDLEAARRAAAKAALAARRTGARRLATVAHGAGIGGLDPAAAAQATVEGTLLALYEFREYKTRPATEPPAPEEVVVCALPGPPADAVRRGVERGEAIGAAVRLARDLGNHPPNRATPAYLAERAGEIAARHGMAMEVWERDRIVAEGMGALASVNQGSAEPPRFIRLEHAPPGHEADAPLVIAGKAVTFDTGGISLKPGLGMAAMKFDMCGGAAVLGTLEAAGRLALPARVIGLIGATDNMPDGKATHPGDIVKALNGKTIEVINTDAEGRLVLADVLSYAGRLTPRPAAVVDLATLTGAIVVALGHVAGGLFANDDALAAQLSQSGDSTGERLWRMPLWKAYQRTLKGDTADLRNVVDKRPSPAGAIFGAKFLEEFVDYPWAHLDIAGVAWESDDVPYSPKGATGFGVRLLADWLARRAGEGGPGAG